MAFLRNICYWCSYRKLVTFLEIHIPNVLHLNRMNCACTKIWFVNQNIISPISHENSSTRPPLTWPKTAHADLEGKSLLFPECTSNDMDIMLNVYIGNTSNLLICSLFLTANHQQWTPCTPHWGSTNASDVVLTIYIDHESKSDKWPSTCVDFSFRCNIWSSWFSLEQNCWFIEDKLSSTAVDFIRSEGIAERQHLVWGKASSLSMPRTYRGVKSVT